MKVASMRNARRTTCLIVLGFMILMLVAAAKPAFAAEGYLNVINVQAPATVELGQKFDVKVTIDYYMPYSWGPVLIWVAIWDEDKDDYAMPTADESGKNLDVAGTGQKDVIITITAPDKEMTWHLSAYARAKVSGTWQQSTGYEKLFTVEVKLQRFHVGVSVDPFEAEQYMTIQGEGDYDKGEKVEVRFLSTVPGATGTQYIFVTYLVDGAQVAGTPITLTMDKDHDIVVKYKTQYYLTATSDYGRVTGEGWYDKGTQATASLDIDKVSAGTPYVNRFKRWSADASGTELKSNPITMDGPKTARAVWEKEFGCLVATATYGSELSPEVSFLRGFRDNTVLRTNSGNEFMKVFNQFYYSFSPSVAGYIYAHPEVRMGMKIVLYPLMGILRSSAITYSLLSFAPELAIVVAGLVASSLIGLVYFTPIALALLIGTRRLGRAQLRTRHLVPVATIGLVSILFITIAEVTGIAALMQLATATFVLATVCVTSGYTAIKVLERLNWAT